MLGHDPSKWLSDEGYQIKSILFGGNPTFLFLFWSISPFFRTKFFFLDKQIPKWNFSKNLKSGLVFFYALKWKNKLCSPRPVLVKSIVWGVYANESRFWGCPKIGFLNLVFWTIFRQKNSNLSSFQDHLCFHSNIKTDSEDLAQVRIKICAASNSTVRSIWPFYF